jgi:hypothetical protein
MLYAVGSMLEGNGEISGGKIFVSYGFRSGDESN